MRTRSKKNCRKGAVAVEFALTSPLLFLILFGALELSHANMVFNVTEAAAYEGAREGIVPGASVAEVEAACQRILDVSSVRSATIRVTPANLAIQSDTIRVDIDVPYTANTLIPPFFTRGMQIQRSCVLSREDAS